MTPRRVLVMGVSGSGKSTLGALLAQRLGLPFADADAFHPEANIRKMSAGNPLSDDDRWPWLDALGAWLAAQERGGVIGCSALKRSYRDRLRGHAPGLLVVHPYGDFALIAARQAARPSHFMPPALMESQFRTLEPPTPEEGALGLDVADPPEALAARAAAWVDARSGRA
ncbi:gluconokinase [Sabulicella glaciei]|uniref:Gluconokinase n=1 Tax=Sabulicella glaciei TaxID=2984948 RepID=A0ABT3NXS3_9PROT|nr:gluconokinase [Roseococcus sp. MDT2-1-1]MCW8086708.1 gluconokinase [Roseococcus sp. MDT2-1-1]